MIARTPGQQQEQLRKTAIQTTIQRGQVIVIVAHLLVAVDASGGINPTERVR